MYMIAGKKLRGKKNSRKVHFTDVVEGGGREWNKKIVKEGEKKR